MELCNALIHAIGTILAIFLLVKSANFRQLIFSLSVYLCLIFSTAYHYWLWMQTACEDFHRLDHVGIFLLIAGTATALIHNEKFIHFVWLIMAGIVSGILLGNVVMPTNILTYCYLCFGWICISFATFEIERGERFYRSFLNKETYLLCLGGTIMTVGSLINLYNYRFGHPVFHLMTLIGSLFYVRLIFRR